MKKIITGLGFLFAGTLLYMTTGIVAGMHIEYTTGWDTQLGRFWQTVLNCGLFPITVFAYILMAAGIAFALWGVFGKNE